uniref:Uncharacterized protein n=1 Tax=Prymnesium polylepis TaxID=72548 RepID=A0A7S4MH49_9EUKA
MLRTGGLILFGTTYGLIFAFVLVVDLKVRVFAALRPRNQQVNAAGYGICAAAIGAYSVTMIKLLTNAIGDLGNVGLQPVIAVILLLLCTSAPFQLYLLNGALKASKATFAIPLYVRSRPATASGPSPQCTTAWQGSAGQGAAWRSKSPTRPPLSTLSACAPTSSSALASHRTSSSTRRSRPPLPIPRTRRRASTGRNHRPRASGSRLRSSMRSGVRLARAQRPWRYSLRVCVHRDARLRVSSRRGDLTPSLGHGDLRCAIAISRDGRRRRSRKLV